MTEFKPIDWKCRACGVHPGEKCRSRNDKPVGYYHQVRHFDFNQENDL